MENRRQGSGRKSLKRTVRRLARTVSDRLKGIVNPNSMRPTRKILRVREDTFEQAGEMFKDFFIKYAHLQPNHRVLDIGCSAGRMAIPLTHYLSAEGGYWGFDIRKEAIQWCQEHIASKYSNFHFLHGEVYNKKYNPDNKVQPKDYKFPLEDASFDLVFLISVFSHMVPADLENYLGEIARMLKPGGMCLGTYFLYDKESQERLYFGRPMLDFHHQGENYRTSNADSPEDAIAYEEGYLTRLLESKGLQISQRLRRGTWVEYKNYLSFQDIVIVTKK